MINDIANDENIYPSKNQLKSKLPPRILENFYVKEVFVFINTLIQRTELIEREPLMD